MKPPSKKPRTNDFEPINPVAKAVSESGESIHTDGKWSCAPFTMEIANKFLFNFAASYSGGGLKRLYEYARWFNGNGGAWFIIHPHSEGLIKEFPNNHFFLATQNKYQRVFNDCGYLEQIGKEIGRPDLYYSYGIPIYARLGRVNWFHLSNVLPLSSKNIPLSLFDRFLRLRFLGWRISRNYHNADVISAESSYSLGLVDIKQTEKLFLSVNGSNDELGELRNRYMRDKDNIATVVGTQKHKALEDSYQVFEMLRQGNNQLRLVIIGDEKFISEELRADKNVIVKGVLQRNEVIECLQKSRYYISTTRIENSYNAAAEGIIFANESYISDIEPHLELLMDVPFDRVSIPNMINPILHIKRDDISGNNLKSWDEIIAGMISTVRIRLRNIPPHAD